MHKVEIDGGTWVDEDKAYAAAQDLEKVFNEWADRHSIAKRSTTCEVRVSQEYP